MKLPQVPLIQLALVQIFIGIPWAFSQEQVPIEGLENLYTTQKSVICQTVGNQLCVSPANDIVMSLLDCATGSELPFPTFEINVPPGLDLEFYMTKNPTAIHDSFFLVTQAVANTPPGILDECTMTDPGIYTPPLVIEPFDQSTLTRHIVPSAVVDQMAAESMANDFVVMIARDCDSSVSAVAGVRITRNGGDSELDLQAITGPDTAPAFTTIQHELTVENMDSEDIEDLAVEVGLNFGFADVEEISIEDEFGIVETYHPAGLPFTFFFDIKSGETQLITVKARLRSIGGHSLYVQVLGDECDDRDRENLYTNATPPPLRINKIGMARTGDLAETELIITNPGNEPLEADLSGTNEDGQAMSLASQVNRPGFLGNNNRVQLAPGQTQVIRFSESSMSLNRFMVHVSSDKPFYALVRQQRRVVGRSGTRQTGSTAVMMDVNQASQVIGAGVIPFKIVAAQNKKIVVNNYNLEARVVTVNVRDADSGYILRQFTGVIAESLGILTFPLVAGLDEDAYIEIDGGPGIFAELEQCSADDFKLFKMRVQPNAVPRSESGGFAGSADFAQPFYQVPVPTISYGPSTYDMFVFPLTDQGITANSVSFNYDDNCGVNTSGSYLFLTPTAGANTSFSVGLNSNTSLRGGFAFFDDPGTATSFRWIEGSDTFFMQAVEPVSRGRLYLPDVLLDGQVVPVLPPIRVQVYTAAAVTLSIASFAADGTLLGLKDLSLTAGGHILCNNDLDLSQGIAYLEIQIPDDHPAPFWFNALADEATLDYKDQLPLLAIEGATIFTQIANAISSWGEGGGPNCLGDMPDMVDLVDFVNRNYMCPPAP